MKGFDYMADKPANYSVRHWNELARAVCDSGGFIREDGDLKETFIYRKGPRMVAEIYDIRVLANDLRRVR